ncbi:MAG: DUF1648 domain-containing protein [Chthoniobacteraceae bacterium]
MKNSRIGPLFLAFLLAAFVAFVAYSSKELPDRVATHFDLHGKANGWMTRAQHLKFTIGVGVGTPLFILGVFALVAKMKGWGLNIPNKDYWLAPEQQEQTYAFLQRHGMWLACLMVVFHAGMFESVVLANSQAPAFLSPAHVAWLTGGFIALLVVWIAMLFLRFRVPSK